MIFSNHVAAVGNTNGLKLYLNGELIKERVKGNSGGVITPTIHDFMIGAYGNTKSRMNFAIMRFHDRPLAKAEIDYNRAIDAVRYLQPANTRGALALSAPVFYQASDAPAITTVVPDVRFGDKAIVAGTFEGSGESMAIEYWKDGGAVTQEVNGVIAGKTFSATLDPLEAGATYGYRVTLAAGSAATTSPGTFTLPAAGAVATTRNRENARVRFSVYVTTQGAGDTAVWVEAGKTGEGDFRVVTPPLTIAYGDTQAKTIDAFSPWLDRSVTFRVAASNACSRVANGCWTNYFGECAYTVTDVSAYTFKTGGNGMYGDASNWTCSTQTGYGAPCSRQSEARFANGQTCVLGVDAAYTNRLMRWGETQNLTVMLTGTVANAAYAANIVGGYMYGNTYILRDIAVTEENGIEIGNARRLDSYNRSYNNLVWIQRGATLRTLGYGLILCGSRFSELRISDDGRLETGYVAFACGSEGLMFRFQGAAPKLRVNYVGSDHGDVVNCSHPTTDGDVVFRFEVPRGGYAEPPVLTSGTAAEDRFGRLHDGSTGKCVIEVPLDSPAFEDGRRVNTLLVAAVLLFGKRPQSPLVQVRVHCGRFLTETDIADDRLIDGSLLEQIEETIGFLKKHINVRFVITGKPRRDQIWDYPLEALRETVINAICHRDYADSADIQIKVFDDHIRLWSPGLLPYGLTVEDLLSRSHASKPRNKLIAQVLYDLEIIERYGSGIHRMFDACANAGLPEPILKEETGGFLITFRKAVVAEDAAGEFITLPDERVRAQVTPQAATDTEILEREFAAATGQATGQVTGQVAGQVLRFCEQQPQPARKIQELLKLKHRETFLNNYLRPLLRSGWMEPTIPDKPRSSRQMYRLTERGRAVLTSIKKADMC